MSSELGVRRNRRRPQKTQIISATEPAILGCTNDDDVLISVDGIDGEAVDVVLRNFPLRKFLWGARSIGVPQLARSIVVICSAALSCACAYSPDTIDRTVSYNEAVANSNNEILLLNIVRAESKISDVLFSAGSKYLGRYAYPSATAIAAVVPRKTNHIVGDGCEQSAH